MRILHTSDWHLGHVLHGHSRLYEHDCFLRWLADTVEAEAIDALLVCGDVFDAANPPAEAQRLYYAFLLELHRRRPDLGVVVIAGNHDSAGRLEAPRDLLSEFGVHVVGHVERDPAGRLVTERLVVELRDASGRVAAFVAAVPFLREADLAVHADAGDPLVAGVRSLYGEVLDVARRRRAPDQAIVALGHCYMTGGALSELSERRILGGNQHALPDDLFPRDVAYAALGHLHRAQAVAGRENVRYCGAPIALSATEIDYPHQVCVVELRGAHCDSVRFLRVPRSVGWRRIPAVGALPLDAAIAAIGALPARTADAPDQRRPFVEIALRLDGPEPEAARRCAEALATREARLLRVVTTREAGAREEAAVAPERTLDDLSPDAVFRELYRVRYDGEPSPDVLRAFHELVDAVGQEGA